MKRYRVIKTWRAVRGNAPAVYQKIVWLWFKLMLLFIILVGLGGLLGL